jgi:hypothetical protein
MEFVTKSREFQSSVTRNASVEAEIGRIFLSFLGLYLASH